MANIFSSTDILIAKNNIDKWAVIACDQFTSNLDYWKELEGYINNDESYLKCIYPEAYLVNGITKDINDISLTMSKYINNKDIYFNEYKDSYIYVERSLNNNQIRKGLVGIIDLEEYDYSSNNSIIRPSEETVIDRVPLRAKVREKASLDLSHVILFLDDERKEIIESINKEELDRIYDFDLNMDGGHIEGYLLNNEEKKRIDKLISEYEKRKGDLVYAVGDGNHSLAAAKYVYDKYKEEIGEEALTRPYRYALVELENIYDQAQDFKPIHRIITSNKNEEILKDLINQADGEEIVKWYLGDNVGEFHNKSIKDLQLLLDEDLNKYQSKIDYIHEEKELLKAVKELKALGLYMPSIKKDSLFEYINNNGPYARKSFSIGEAKEKRYYLETRIIR